MVKLCLALLLVMISAKTGRAGPPPGTAPGLAAAGTGEADILTAGEDVFVREFVLNRSTAALYAVFESTSPEHAAAAYLRQGVYRREFLILFAIARDSRTTFKMLVREREKGVTLQTLAGKNKLNLMNIFREAAALQEKIETETSGMRSAQDTSSRAVRAAVTDTDDELATSPDK